MLIKAQLVAKIAGILQRPRRSREMTHLCSFRVAHAENRFCHVAWRGAGDIIGAAGA